MASSSKHSGKERIWNSYVTWRVQHHFTRMVLGLRQWAYDSNVWDYGPMRNDVIMLTYVKFSTCTSIRQRALNKMRFMAIHRVHRKYYLPLHVLGLPLLTPTKPHFSTQVPIFSLSYDQHAKNAARIVPGQAKPHPRTQLCSCWLLLTY